MASKVTAVAAKIPPRRPRDSSDDFCAGSLGSIAGSAVETPVVDKASAASAASKKPIETLEIASTASTKGSGSAVSPSGRRPFRKRAGTFDFLVNFDDDTTLNLSNTDDNSKAMPPIDSLQSIIPLSARNINGTAADKGRDRSNTLDHLDALGAEAGEAAAKIKGERKPRSGSISARSIEGDNSSHGTMTSQSQRFLLEAFMGDAEESLMQGRDRLGSFDARDRIGSFDVKALGSLESRERLGSFEARDRLTSLDSKEKGDTKSLPDTVERARSGSLPFRRERLESWGGMSELSAPHHAESATDGGSTSAAALAAKLYTSIANDVFAAANLDGNESVSSFLVNDAVIPTRISIGNRSRLNSVASESSALDVQLPAENDLGADLQKYVSAAMASVGDQLAAVTAVDKLPNDQDSVASSTLSPMIGAATDSKASSVGGRSRSNSLSSNLNFSVDYDAVQAAVDAAQTAAAAVDLANIANGANTPSSGNKKRKAPKLPRSHTPDVQSSSQPKPKPAPPLQMTLPPIPKSKMDDKDMEILRERARAAAGYVPPPASGTPLPPKKKAKLDPVLSTPGYKTQGSFQTPRTSNTTYSNMTPGTPYTPAMSTPGSAKSTVSKGQASQKWDSMFDYLILFIKERRGIETKDMSEEDIKEWVWDGNVPTTYKTKDGKALGRWVNNQRSAKSKGNLKEDREKRLVDAGLKWSVLASNSWNEMLEELRMYVADQTKSGRKWDGNVPTNYRIKTKNPTGGKEDEDKNLGRWVNRQRSLYQAGKLRKDRQEALEKVGLKWSMLATTSWESMFETLCEYVRSKTKDGGEWDGNVPANYRTEDTPPRALGRWINRQRSAYGKDKLKAEYIEKLNSIGLKWSVHERRPISTPDSVRSAPAAVVVRGTPPTASKVAAASTSAAPKPDSATSAAVPPPVANGRPPLAPVKPVVAAAAVAAVKKAPGPTPTAVGSASVPTTTTAATAATPASSTTTSATPAAASAAAPPAPAATATTTTTASPAVATTASTNT
eukprot:CAMPEP_0113658962 /NCGR_PEP_ID=MMETSP0017_2-20120614/32062_1 /TAXON_ID=2856 /ORGANISM="Cylindrotheca closterium" /LENGTH=1012 /DNA_ID=CAMNT_0000573397 /DNA_START=113 /DNA_END=3147 /DNA_ORIENTATION=+ /assembly_acc=CAM_ASM_000147